MGLIVTYFLLSKETYVTSYLPKNQAFFYEKTVVLSPRYVKSEWCRKELQEFIRAAERSGGVFINSKSRIFKVVKFPVPRDQHPAEIEGLLGYEFFREDPDTHPPP
jgi:hypothetical protein